MDAAVSDADLVRQARAGDQSAWRRLVLRHSPALAAYLGTRLRRPSVVERLVATTIVAAWRSLGDLKDDHDFPAWLRRLGGSHAMAWHQSHPGEPLDELLPVDRRGIDPPLAARLGRLDRAIGVLPEEQRKILELHWRGGLDQTALAACLHLDPARISSAIEAALVALDLALDGK